MKIYEIRDDLTKQLVGCLMYFKKEKSCIIELQDDLTEWTAPLLFTNLVKNHQFTVGRELSKLWVEERIIPSDRQNISMILANAKLSEYDEIGLLELSHGRCCQDSLYIKKVDVLPEFVQNRSYKTLTECVIGSNHSILCFFRDKSVKRMNLESLPSSPDLQKILANEALYQSGVIAAGGYCITFNSSIDLPAEVLYNLGEPIPLTIDDFIMFIQQNTLDSSDCCALLECTRQNLSYLVSKDRLSPIKDEVKGNIFLKGDTLRSRW